MQLNLEVFTIDPAATCLKIEDFIREKLAELHRDGIVVPISGGLDSSTVASLCAQAVGREKVTGLLLPEKAGNPDAARFAKLLANQLGIRTSVIDISDILAPLGTYKFITNRIPSRTLVKKTIQEFLPDVPHNYFLAQIKGNGNRITRQGMASYYSKHRIRLVVTYKFAEEQNLMVVGCAHKSEDLLGLFSKFGVDDNADVMPLKNLYRSHILQLARYLGVPEEIIQRKPNPDMLPGVEDKYFDILGIPADTCDLILYGIEHGIPTQEIAAQLEVKPELVAEVANLVRITDHMRHPSMAPEL